jgi:AraC-like DNA-binding protein
MLGDGGRRKQIAQTLGFVDGSHLATVFRTETGQRLAEYRRGAAMGRRPPSGPVTAR